MSDHTKHPAYRRSIAPAGICITCWAKGGPPVPGEPFRWGWPFTYPGEGLPVYYCTRCQEEHRAMGVQLIPQRELAFALEITRGNQ